jgi:hypothetical protein
MTILPIKPVELMQGEFTNFIGVWEDHVPKFVCDKVIQSFENAIDNSSNNFNQQDEVDANEPIIMDGSEQFPNKNLGRKDIGIMLNLYDTERTMEVNQYLHSCFLDYIREYGNLSTTPLISTDVKVQKTLPTGGYHVWHSESSGHTMAQRVLVWTMYLNDVEDGGETEFLYQSTRIKPKRGTVVVWPAAYTHLHRGNPPLSGHKYIATGWYINAFISN